MDETTTCGLFNWRPSWLQSLATEKAYAAIYSIIGIIQGMGFSYLTSVLSTIEKQFGIRSKETAWVFSGNEISQICFVFVLPFLGLIRKRALWTSIAMMMTSIGLLLCATPFFLKDKSLYNGGWNIQQRSDICDHMIVDKDESCSNNIRDYSAMVMIFVGFFISGIGSSFYYSFGIPYIDDNVSKNSSPAVLGFVYAARSLGPGLGYILGSFCLSIYAAPGREGILVEGDNGWLGAWWLGFVIIAALTGVVSPFLALFPERLPNQEKTFAKELKKINNGGIKTGIEYIKDTKDCALRLLKNKIYIYNLLSGIIGLLALVGFSTFLPKYFEYHFRQKASDSGLSSLFSSLFTGIGVLLSGQVISRFKFRARTLAAWSIFIWAMAVLTMISISFIACPKLEVYQGSSLYSSCQETCDCPSSEFKPTCSKDGLSLFLTPCHAGCGQVTVQEIDGVEKKVFSDCKCAALIANERNLSTLAKEVRSPLVVEKPTSMAIEGFCHSSNCDELFYITGALFAGISFLASTKTIGGALIILRAVEEQDKAASLIISISMLSLFALFPSPIIFGALIDNTCTFWGSSCGEETNCLLYDTDVMRNYMSWVTATCFFVALLFDIGVWKEVDQLQLYDQEEEKEKPEQNISIKQL